MHTATEIETGTGTEIQQKTQTENDIPDPVATDEETTMINDERRTEVAREKDGTVIGGIGRGEIENGTEIGSENVNETESHGKKRGREI